ncbi:MAG: ABC transporter substrate-binding protein [Nitrospirota bacterium]|nr:ABC transporter substrate-binding protein [Nitrospirota bacterium]
MKSIGKSVLILVCLFSLIFGAALNPSISIAAKAGKTAKEVKADPGNMWVGKPNAVFDANKMSDMSDYDPATWISPTGDTIKIAVVAPFSGPATVTGEYIWTSVTWAAHDINKRGGIFVDGKKKLVEVIKADHMSKPDQCKKVCERMALQEKVHAFIGTPSSALMKIMNETATKYKLISVNAMSLADEIMDARNFSRYAFMTTWSAEQVGRAIAYYYGQVRKKEKKFFILNQDYSFGHETAEGFKKGLEEYYPEAQLVGEDYHKLFLTDFAPYLEKIKASGAEVIYSTDWDPDGRNLFKQARQMNVMLPFASIYMDLPNMLQESGIEATKGLICLSPFNTTNPYFKTPGHIKFYKAWNNLWQDKWKTAPYNSTFYEHPTSYLGAWTMSAYWLLSVIERANSIDPEKIIAIWENDTYQAVNGKVMRMRACDHKVIQNLSVSEFVPPAQQKVSFNIPPYYWLKSASYYGPTFDIPAAKILPWMDQKLDRCKGKNGWGQ